MSVATVAGSGQKREPGLHPGVSCRWQGSKYLSRCLLLPGALAGLEVKHPGLGLVLIWDASAADSGLTQCITTLIPKHIYSNVLSPFYSPLPR